MGAIGSIGAVSPLVSIPQVVLGQISGYYGDAVFITRMQMVCHNLQEKMNILNETMLLQIRSRCVAAIQLAKNFDTQVETLSGKQESLISDTPPKDPAETVILLSEIAEYRKAIAQETSLCKLESLFMQFKEHLVDALSDRECRDELQYVPPFSLNDVLVKAKNREKGDIFIIPNRARVEENAETGGSWGRNHGDYGTQGGPLPSIEVSITSNRYHDWMHHGSAFGDFGIDRFLPGELFLGKKEGDVVTFPFKGKEVKLICRQKPYRYSYGGMTFEDVFKWMTSSPAAEDPDSYVPPISREEQIAKIRKLHDNYVASCRKI